MKNTKNSEYKIVITSDVKNSEDKLKIENKVEISGTPAKDEIDVEEYMYFAVNSVNALIKAHSKALTDDEDMSKLIRLAIISKFADE
ncbi:MAG: hypothetical protein ABF723_12130 [Lentilactobacillus hilgardii]|uniref:hypothetical protein n=1 Tax=Lentilactobacillus hilgardii TaxID=1588 RepID=UPI0039ED90FD